MDQNQLTDILRQHLERWRWHGVDWLPAPGEQAESLQLGELLDAHAEQQLTAPDESRVVETEQNAPTMETQPMVAERSRTFASTPAIPNPVDERPYGNVLTDRATALSILSEEVAACTKCDILAKSRQQTVFGVGNPNARLCFYGEAPGADEDRQGEPFVGAAGQLLDRIMAACKLSRDDVYIMNTIKCRPPNNRNPNDQEQANCWSFAERQLEIIQPEFICCLGRIAAQSLLRTDLSIGRLRGEFHRYRSSRVIVTYHPAYLLRTPAAKKQTWDDMQMLMKEMGIGV
ncbi:MAG: uracil-DNA glycosylase [Pirellulaceae bacterium]